MPKIVTTHVVRSDQVAHYLRPRDDLVIERDDGECEFALVSGPFDRYHRSVRRAVGSAEPDDERDGLVALTETVTYHLAIPVWRPLFALPVRGLLRQPHHPADQDDEPTGTGPGPGGRRRTTSTPGSRSGLSLHVRVRRPERVPGRAAEPDQHLLPPGLRGQRGRGRA